MISRQLMRITPLLLQLPQRRRARESARRGTGWPARAQ
jgi:hypothetical protein